MSKVPEGATLSEDGYYWWDGSDWQPVDGSEAGSDAGASASSTDAGAAQPAGSGGDDEEVAVRVEASLEEEPVELTLDELLAEGFTPDDEAMV